MATYREILSSLSGKHNPMTTAEIAKEIGVQPNDVATVLKRAAEKGWATVGEGGVYAITEEGQKELKSRVGDEAYKTTLISNTVEGFLKAIRTLDDDDDKHRPSILVVFIQL